MPVQADHPDAAVKMMLRYRINQLRVRQLRVGLLVAIALLILGCFAAAPGLAAEMPAVAAAGYHHAISRPSATVQRQFDRGLLLIYGFNREAAARVFQTAVSLDPDCAICYWGMAYAIGAAGSGGMDQPRWQAAQVAIQQAISHSEGASPAERSWIAALARAYADGEATPQTAQRDYIQAMRTVVAEDPTDPDAATLLAAGLMDSVGWQVWSPTGELTSVGREVVTLLESVLQRYPHHPGALHIYIHAVEAQHPEWAIAVADRLRQLDLDIAHLIHMPSHIYLRVGRYADAIAVNQRAIAVADQTASDYAPTDVFAYAYRPHNYHFLWSIAMLTGQSALATQTAQQVAALVDQQLVRQPGYGTLQHYLALPLYTLVQFGQWEQILSQPPPDADLAYLTGVWHYARGRAQVGMGNLAAARQSWQQVRQLANSPALVGVTLWEVNRAADLLHIAADVLAGEMAAQQQDWPTAIQWLQQAIAREDALLYDEPPPWPSPVRRSLAAVLLAAGEPTQAAATYQADLRRYPANPVSSRGLAQSQAAMQTAAGQANGLPNSPIP